MSKANVLSGRQTRLRERLRLACSPKGLLALTLCAVSLVLLGMFVQSFPGYLPLDDSYICLVFARNVWERGEFFSYNPGQISTGITSPLYAVLLAAFYGIVRDWHQAVLSLGVVTFACALAAGMRLAYRIAGYWAMVAFVGLFGFSGQMAFFSLLGMEPMLYIALAFAAFLAFTERRFFVAGIATGFAMLCRPESLFILFVLAVALGVEAFSYMWRKEWAELKRSVLSGLCMGAGFLLPALPWVVRCLMVSHTFMSSTVAWKTYDVVPWRLTWYYWVSSMRMYFPDNLDNMLVMQAGKADMYMAFRKYVPLPLVAAGSFFLIRPKKTWLFVPFLFIPVHLLVTGFMNAGCSESERYLCLVYALTYLYLGVLFGGLLALKMKTFWKKAVTRGLAWCGLIALSALLLSDYELYVDIFRMKAKYFYDRDYKIGVWLAEHTPPNTRVALFQAGGIAFFGRRYILDGGGVTEHTIWPYLRRHAFSEAMVDRGADYIAPFGADWLADEGLLMSDTQFFKFIPMSCRGLYKIRKNALREFVMKHKDGLKMGPLAE